MKIEDLIDENYDKLNENDRYIWNYILHHKKECQTMSIGELAASCNVSHSTILRFARKLGLQGYGELKIYLKWENRPEVLFDKEEIENTYQDIVRTMDMLKNRDFTDVFEIMDQANRIYVYGSGAVQKNAAKEFKRNLIFCDKLVYVVEGSHETRVILNNLKENDAFFLISLSGNNTFVNEFAGKIKEKGGRVIAITQTGNNRLSQLSDVNLQFYTHSVAAKGDKVKICSTAQFFVINEFLLLKYLEYR